MDKWQKINAFWNSFGWKAYDEQTVPDDAQLPYITYSLAVDNLDTVVTMAASLWDRSTSWERVSKKADSISEVLIAMHPPTLTVDGGRIYITPGTPFAQRMSDTNDAMIRRVYLNIEVEYFTEH